jgi:hypothetical protein
MKPPLTVKIGTVTAFGTLHYGSLSVLDPHH